MYYLAESLYQKGDRGSARTYFEQIVARQHRAASTTSRRSSGSSRSRSSTRTIERRAVRLDALAVVAGERRRRCRTSAASTPSRRTSYDDALALLQPGAEGLGLRAPGAVLHRHDVRREEGSRARRPTSSPISIARKPRTSDRPPRDRARRSSRSAASTTSASSRRSRSTATCSSIATATCSPTRCTRSRGST